MISSSDILNGKILIVDDQKANILLLERMLVSAGYTSVASTTDPLEVCELHRKNHYDLILLDLEMPGMDGFQVMEGLKETEPGGYLPVIVITAHPGYKLRSLKSGARDFISKPFELAEVLARVRNMLEVRLLHAETKKYINALELQIQEVEVSRGLVRRQSDEVKRLYDKIKSVEGVAMEEGEAAALAQPQMPRKPGMHTLLYVEDNPVDMELVEQLIARHPDMRLLTAVNGKSGIEIARVSQPEVIMMDINLPDISGFKALTILRSDPATKHIPVIAISVNAMPINIEVGLEEGFFRYITKPIKVNELMDALGEALKVAVNKTANDK